MPRSIDLDVVAPDDDFKEQPKVDTQIASKAESSSPLEVKTAESTPLEKPKKKKPLAKPVHPNSSTSEFRQKVYELLGHTKHPFSSFLARPKVFSFEEKDDKEEILVVLRQHWFTNISWIVTAIFMSLLPAFFNIVPVFESLPGNYLFVTGLFWYLITFAFAFEKFLSWYFNVYIITDERVVDVDFNNLLNKRFSEAKISMIQDVTSQVTGLYQTMFNYGFVFIQTAAEVPELGFENVPDPQRVIKILQQLRSEEEQEAIEGRIR